MRSPSTHTETTAPGLPRKPVAVNPIDLAIVEITDDYVVVDIKKLEAALKEMGLAEGPAVSGIIKVGFPYSAEDYGDDNFDEWD